MSRQKISFDMDGVIQQCPYLEPEMRTNREYWKIPAVFEATASLQWLSYFYDVYIISARAHVGANIGLRAWLDVSGLKLDAIAGVITCEGKDNVDKSVIADIIGSVIHFDDHPEHVRSMKGRGVLVPSEYPGSADAKGLLPSCSTWAEIRAFLTSPGMVLHGTEYDVLSPAVPGPYPEALDEMVLVQ